MWSVIWICIVGSGEKKWLVIDCFVCLKKAFLKKKKNSE